MWIPKSLKVTDFMSHQDTKYEFAQGVATMIYGVNRDDDAQESNGSGKSVLIESISMALIGSPLRDVRSADLVMDGKDALEVEFVLYNSRFDREMKIWRRVPIKGTSKLSVYVDGKPQDDRIPSVRDGDAFILEQLDITKEDLLNYFIISKEKYVSFFAFGDTKKKQVVARFSNANIIDPVFDVIKSDVKSIDGELTGIDRQQISVQGKIEVIQDRLSKPKTDYAAKRKEEIQALEKRVQAGRDMISSKEIQLAKAMTTYDNAEKALRDFKIVDFSGQLEGVLLDAKKLVDQTEQARDQRKECDEFIHELEHIIAGTIECPSCKYKFVLGKDVNAEQAAELLPQAKEELEAIKKEIAQFDEQLVEIEKKRDQIREQERIQKRKQSQLEDNVRIAKREKSGHELDLQRYKDGWEEIGNELEGLREAKLQTEDNSADEKALKDLRKEEKALEKSLRAMEKDRGECAEWDHKFKRFKTHLANKAISSIESFTTHYLKQMNTNLGLKLSGYKVKSNGELSEKIDAIVMRNGLELAGFGRFSGGEKVRIEICNILALQGLINLNSNSGGLDLLCLDEIIESVDGIGVTELMKALSLLNKTVLVITHTAHSGVYEHIVQVVKEDGYSKIVA